NLGTHIYLEIQALNRKTDAIPLSFLNRVLVKSSSVSQSFISDLSKLQKVNDGSWDSNIITTSIAVFSLYGTDKTDAVSRAINYLNRRVSNDGSWGGNIETTSWALISLHGAELSRVLVSQRPTDSVGAKDSDTEICGDGVDNDNDGSLDCAEPKCLDTPLCKCDNNVKDDDELGVDCGGSCVVSCVDSEEDEQDTEETPVTTEPSDSSEEEDTTEVDEGSSLWIWILIIVVILLGGGSFFYIKYVKTGKVDLSSLFKKKTNKPNFDEFRRQAEFKPVTPVNRPTSRPGNSSFQKPIQPFNAGAARRSKDEDELDKSLKEAEKLLKG
ncbi:MAG: hypothetical protein FD167_5347, partial [bacterium]